MIISLVQNISLIISIGVLYHYVSRWSPSKPLAASILNGLLFGLAAIFAMSMPVHMSEGIIYDGRSIILAIGGLFGGTIVALVSGITAGLYRILAIGGTGRVAGLATIIFSSLIGTVFYNRHRPEKSPLTLPKLLGIGILVHVFMLASQFILPEDRWKEVLPVIALPVIVLYPIGFTLIGLLFLDEEERVRNVRMLEESETRYKLLFRNNHTSMLLIDPGSGAIVDANPAAVSFYGWSREELLTKKISDINTMEPDLVAEEIRQASMRSSSFYLFRHRLASGEQRDVEVFTGPVEYFGKHLLFSIIHDATARVQAQREVRELNQTLEQRVDRRTRELEEANRELEAFAYSVSHDLRAPLRSIEGFGSILAEESAAVLTPASLHYLERITSNAKKMSTLIDDLLRLSRIGRQNIAFSRVDLSALARELGDDLAAQYPGRDLVFEVEDGLWATADRTLLASLLGNLLSNAWKFTLHVEKAKIRFFSVLESGERAFCVEDNGVGFDMRYSDKLFSPFQRLHGDQEYSGSGIGLSIVRRIAARHGGRAWGFAEPGNGARFYFTLGQE